MIDYVDASYGTDSDANAYYVVNVIANKKLSVGGKAVDVSTITPELLREVLHEADGNEANVSTGYQAIVFLIRGHDLKDTSIATAARRGTRMESHARKRTHTALETTKSKGGHGAQRGQH